MGRLLDNDGQEKSGVPNGLSPRVLCLEVAVEKEWPGH